MAIAAKPTSWLRTPSGRTLGPERDVELAGRQPRDDHDPAQVALGEGRVRRRAIGRALDEERLLPRRGVDAARRDVEQAVGDGDRPRSRGVVVGDHDAIRVTVWRSRYRMAIGASATPRARAISRIVEATKNGLRTRSRYSRRATIAAFGRSGSLSDIGRRRRSSREPRGAAAAPLASTSAPTGALGSSGGRPTSSTKMASSDGSATSNRVTAAPRATTAARIADWARRRRQLELGVARPGPDADHPAGVRQPGRHDLAVERDPDRAPPAGALERRRPCRRRRPGRGRRSRPTRRGPRRPPSGASRRRASGPRRAARGRPRAGSRG